jgi:beta-xylosidase
MIWNEPNNKSHWDLEADPEWRIFSRMTSLAGEAIAAEAPRLPRVLGGMSPIDPAFLDLLQRHGALEHVDAVAVHGFPLDWNHWPIDAWPEKLALIGGNTSLPVWVSEVGVSTFGAEEVQEWGLRRTSAALV